MENDGNMTMIPSVVFFTSPWRPWQRATEFSFGFTAVDVPQHQGAIAAAHDGTLQVWGVAQGLQKKKTMGTSKKCLVSDYWWVHEGYRLLITIWVDETNESFGFGTLVAGKLKESDPRGTCQKLRPRTPRRKAWLVASQTASCCAVHVRMASAWNFCAGMGDKKTEVPEVTAMICYHLEAKNSTSSLLITISNQHINHY